MFCGHCGQLNPDTNTHCDNCGKEIRLAVNTVSPAAATGERSALPNVENYSAPPTYDKGTQGIRVVFFNQRELRAGWRLLIYCVLAYALALLVGQLLRGRAPGMGGGLTPWFVYVSHGSLLLMVLIPAVIMARWERRSLAHYGLPLALRAAFGKNFWQGVVWGIAWLTVLLIVLRVSGAFVFGRVAVTSQEALRYGLLWAIAFLLVGVAEEFMFRGYFQYTLASGLRFLGSGWGFFAAAAITSLLFAVAHTGNTGESLLGLGTVVAIGAFFAFTLWRTGSLWFAIGFHASWDWAQTFLYGVPNSGVVARGHFLNPTIQGPHWLSGGTVGPEGSALMYPLIALMCLLFARTFPKGARYPVADPVRVQPQDAVSG